MTRGCTSHPLGVDGTHANLPRSALRGGDRGDRSDRGDRRQGGGADPTAGKRELPRKLAVVRGRRAGAESRGGERRSGPEETRGNRPGA
ncbi:hypothetical protein [Streptomyces sp. NPDC051776]|uniref:hypothetical protein n=1 Tax=Streptomyces sp. NPDC051776 TaxID=3155414 RepID=UPI00343DFC32